VPVVPPLVGHDDEYFWNGIADGLLLLRECAGCARLQHPPTPMCQKCGSVEWTVRESPGRGVLYSWIVSRHPTQPDDQPRIVALVELEEGVRMVANLSGVAPRDVRNGAPVEVFFAELDGVRLPQFRLARERRA
jgi:uncharacterized OB-fold protein